MSKESDFLALKEAATRLAQQEERAAGVLDAERRRLAEEFGCRTLAEAEALLRKKESALRKADEAWDEAWEAFRARWGDRL